LLDIKANLDGIFAFYDQHLKEGKWLNKGEIIGEVYNPKSKQVIAYVGEEEMRKLEKLDKVKLSLKNDLQIYPGTITAVNDVAAELEPSPLLDVFGGNILSNQNPRQGHFKPLHPVYQVTVQIDDTAKLAIGRSGTMSIRKYSSIGGNMLRTVIHVLQRELTF
jgi:hypothetical protein